MANGDDFKGQSPWGSPPGGGNGSRRRGGKPPPSIDDIIENIQIHFRNPSLNHYYLLFLF